MIPYITLTEVKSGIVIHVFKQHITSIFTAPEKDESGEPNPVGGKTVVSFIGGSVVVEDNKIDVLEEIKGHARY